MVVFDDHELEISVATYNRADYIKVLLEKNYFDARNRNISFIISDSSPNDKTKTVVENFNKKFNANVIYRHFDKNTIIGYKPMLSIYASRSKYVWVSGDSRFLDFDEFDKKIFPYIKNDIDYICFLDTYFNVKQDGVLSDKTEILHQFFIPSTCIGCSIYKTSIFDFLKDPKEEKCLDDLFKDNYGFGWLGYFFTAFSKSDSYKAAFSKIKINNIADFLGVKKVQTWAKHFMGCWIDDLLNIMDNLPNCYQRKELVLEETWNAMRLDSFHYLLVSRGGDLNRKTFNKYRRNGQISRITRHPIRMYLFANCPIFLLKCARLCYFRIIFVYSLAKKLLNLKH